MFESILTDCNAAGRKASHALLASIALHAAAVGVLVLRHEPAAEVLDRETVYRRVVVVAPLMEMPQVHATVIHPKPLAPTVTAAAEPERWNPAPPAIQPVAPDISAPAFSVAAEPPPVPEAFRQPIALRPPETAVKTGVFEAAANAPAYSPAPRTAARAAVFTTPTAATNAGPAKLAAKVGVFGSRPAAETNINGLGGFAVHVGEWFKTAESPNAGAGRAEPVRSTSFGAPAAAPPAPPRRRPAPARARFDRGVEIVSKPRPRYTDEARRLGVEGEVVLEVLFSADGAVHVKRLLRGLGHGLDERAVEAAMMISFVPARRDGKPVDIVATVRIQFQLA